VRIDFLPHSLVSVGLRKSDQFAGIIYLFAEAIPISNRFLEGIQFFEDCLGLLVVAPEARFPGFFLEILGLLAKPIDLKDTPGVFLRGISVHRYQRRFPFTFCLS
jgi:hypothetical protein